MGSVLNVMPYILQWGADHLVDALDVYVPDWVKRLAAHNRTQMDYIYDQVLLPELAFDHDRMIA